MSLTGKEPKLCKRCRLSPAIKGVYCTLCRKEYDKDYFRANVAEKSASATSLKKELVKWYREQKTGKACRDCLGIYHYAQCDFDHVPGRGAKFMDISKMVRLGYTKEKILQEMTKCDILCKNCHALRTFRRLQNKKGSPNTHE